MTPRPVKARYRVLQAHGPDHADEVITIATVRRYEGAKNLRDAHADSARHHLRDHAAAGDRVTIGPGRRPDSKTVCVYGPTVYHWIETWIEGVEP